MTRPARRNTPLRFINARNAQTELAPWGKHWWLSRPGFTDTKQLTLVRVRMRPGTGHRFHYHPAREEIIYVIDGVAEQWVDREKRTLRAGECAFIRENVNVAAQYADWLTPGDASSAREIPYDSGAIVRSGLAKTAMLAI